MKFLVKVKSCAMVHPGPQGWTLGELEGPVPCSQCSGNYKKG